MISSYPSSAFLADPTGASPLIAAANWVQGALLGTIATVIAILCVAAVGLLMLSGRIDLRRGVTVVLGCFLLFGAAGVVQDMHRDVTLAPAPYANVPPPPPAPPLPANAASYDPYAGASVIR
ncbi:TrbC/VirB2 family protein [Hephaestia mangrovi]|uniref:TrbC/VirB2 family protein n=1 Tax=Hephaestia mangrovi TaxID=2873268 RepID=UPI001CA73B06|nr:TrbC/VirB2 family protein [Hephaestia mangrovi]MBY8826575.1 TrbC/VirB2 family protein [Hephaestia mangrovi]